MGTRPLLRSRRPSSGAHWGRHRRKSKCGSIREPTVAAIRPRLCKSRWRAGRQEEAGIQEGDEALGWALYRAGDSQLRYRTRARRCDSTRQPVLQVPRWCHCGMRRQSGSAPDAIRERPSAQPRLLAALRAAEAARTIELNGKSGDEAMSVAFSCWRSRLSPALWPPDRAPADTRRRPSARQLHYQPLQPNRADGRPGRAPLRLDMAEFRLSGMTRSVPSTPR